jgi:prepilin-type N-terminal cleavage/methylation domain-containing protein
MIAPFRSPAPASSAGFSLVEVVLVIAMIGILSAFMVPGYLGYLERTRVTSAVNRFTTDIAYTRMQAARSGDHTRLSLSADGASYVIERNDPQTDTWQRLRLVRLEEDFRGVEVVAEPIRFDGRGMLRMDDGVEPTVSLRKGERSYTIRVSGAGRVVVQ